MKERYKKNLGTIGISGQQKLFDSHVAIVGAGGLGGAVFENLIRVGVGKITIIDPDTFEPTNLNRQLLSSEKDIGRRKVDVAKERASEINSDIEVIPICEMLTDTNSTELLINANIVCDCIDSITDRFVIQRAANGLGIPMVHAAVAGVIGQMMTIFPGDPGLESIYGDETLVPNKGAEDTLGTPPTTVQAIAALQSHEVIGMITGLQEPLRNKLLKIDMESWQIESFTITS